MISIFLEKNAIGLLMNVLTVSALLDLSKNYKMKELYALILINNNSTKIVGNDA